MSISITLGCYILELVKNDYAECYMVSNYRSTHRLLCSGMQPYTVVCLTCLSVCHHCQCLQEVRSKQFKAFRHFLCTTIKSFMSIWVFRDAVRVLTDVGNLFVGYFGSVFYSFVKQIRSFILFSFLFIHFVFKLLHLTRRFRICFVK